MNDKIGKALCRIGWHKYPKLWTWTAYSAHRHCERCGHLQQERFG